jgi:hypothetical protein
MRGNRKAKKKTFYDRRAGGENLTKDKSQKTDRSSTKFKEREHEIQINKMKRYPPSLNGINKNLP